jgi:hypothetical protein
MNCEGSKNLITISVYGKLTPSEKDQLKAHLRECSRCADLYDKAGKLSHLFNEKEDIPLPNKEKSWQIISAKALGRKSSWLERFAAKKPTFQLSSALLLLVVGFTAGYLVHSSRQRNAEIAQLRQEVLQIREITAASLLRQESLNIRLTEIGLSSLLARSDQGLLGSLLRTLRGDTSVYLRPASIDDPYVYLTDPSAREEFIQSLSEQTSPLVEIALALTRHIEQLKLH